MSTDSVSLSCLQVPKPAPCTPTLKLSIAHNTIIHIPKWDRLVIGHYYSNRISLWNSNTYELIDYRYTHENLHYCIAFSESLGAVYTSGLGGQVSSVNVRQNVLGYYKSDVVSVKLADSLDRLFVIDLQGLVVCTSRGPEIYVLDARTLELKGTMSLNQGSVISDFLFIEKSGILTAVGGELNNYIYSFCVKTMKCISRTRTGCRELNIHGIGYCNVRDMLIVQPKLGMITLWTHETEGKLKLMKKVALQETASSILLIEGLDWFIVSLKSKRVEVYRTSTGRLLMTESVDFEVEGMLYIAKDSKVLLANKDFSQLSFIQCASVTGAEIDV